jgi:hypothetical protein
LQLYADSFSAEDTSIPVAFKSGGNFLSAQKSTMILAHVATLNDVISDQDEWAGAYGSSLPIEGFAIYLAEDLPGSGISYQAVMTDGELSDLVEPGGFCGSRGESKPIFGFRICVDDAFAASFEVRCEARFVDGSQVGPMLAPAVCSAPSHSALEAFRVTVVRKT